MFFRFASPCDNTYNRAAYVNALCEKAGIGYIIDLADNGAEADVYFEDDSLNVPYWKYMYKNSKIVPLDIFGYYGDMSYAKAVAEAMRAIIANDGPFLIHCTEGKDRTGFVCALLEALCGASIKEITKDYMKTYSNYYGIDEKSDKETYDSVIEVIFEDILCTIAGVNNVSMINQDNLASGAMNYLRFGGMSDNEIAQLLVKIK